MTLPLYRDTTRFNGDMIRILSQWKVVPCAQIDEGGSKVFKEAIFLTVWKKSKLG